MHDKTYAFIEDDPAPFQFDTITREGALWLVAEWLGRGGVKEIPRIMIRLDEQHYTEVRNKPYRYVLNRPLPRAAVEGKECPGFTVHVANVLGDNTPPPVKSN